MHSPTVYLNGQYLPLTEAKISVLDRGFLFGDGVYEVIPVYNGHFFHLDDHLQRLENSLALINMATPHNRRQWQKILSPLLTDSPDQYIYLQITRGVAAKRDHAFPSPAIEPTIFAMASPISHLAGKEKGVKAITLDDTRWDLCHVKATTLLANILLRQQAVEQHCAEAILVKNGQVTEGAASNVFAVINNVLTTPPQSNEILPGITRKIILDLAHNNQLATAERNFTLVDLKSASEIWLTSSTREILPVVKLDSETVQKGRPGPVWQAMHTLFQDYKRSVS